MEVCEVGNTFSKVQRIAYQSDITFMDFEAVILDFRSILFENYYVHENTFKKRKKSLEEFIEYKKIPLIIFAPPYKTVQFHKNFEQSLDSILPVKPFSIVKETGYKINILGNNIFTNFLKKYEAHFLYNSYFEKYEGTVIAEVPLTKKVLAFYNETSIFLPELKKSVIDVEVEFLKDLIEITKKINNVKGRELLPEWAEKYFLPKEKQLSENIFKINEGIQKLQNSLQKEEEQFYLIKNKKVLFTGTGNDLESEIENIFRELGFEIMESDRNRDDLIVKYKDKIAVVEIKGVNGTSGEKHASQLEKWINIYYQKSDILPKGILIVNSFKEKELTEREGETFPHQMLEFSKMRKHCLITSLQFLGLYFAALSESVKEELIESLFSSVGIYKGFEEFKDFIVE